MLQLFSLEGLAQKQMLAEHDISVCLTANSALVIFVYLNMATIEAKDRARLIERINSIKNRDVLDELNRLLEIDIEESVYQTSDEQKKEIEMAREQISSGQGIPSNVAEKEIDEWLSR